MSKNAKDHAVVFVADKLTENQAADLVGAFAKAKNKVAPNARVTGGMTKRDNIGKILQDGIKKITDGQSK